MFIAPYDMDAPWDTRGVPGTYRFLNRVWNLVQEFVEVEVEVGSQVSSENISGPSEEAQKFTEDTSRTSSASSDILKIAHATIKKVTSDIEDEKFNTAVAAMMEMVNGLYKIKDSYGIDQSDEWRFALESLLQILAPFAPHIAEELWHDLGHTDTIHIDHWPKWDDSFIQSDKMTIIVQVNGKLRAKLELPVGTDEAVVKDAALNDENVRRFVDGEPKKVIYVVGKLVNIVI